MCEFFTHIERKGREEGKGRKGRKGKKGREERWEMKGFCLFEKRAGKNVF